MTSIEYKKFASSSYNLLYQAFEQNVETMGYRIAIEFMEKSLSYCMLDSLSQAFTSRLQVADPENQRVAILMNRCLELPIAVLAVVRAGFSAAVIDAGVLDQRLTSMLHDSGAQIIVTTTEHAERVSMLSSHLPVQILSIAELEKMPRGQNSARILSTYSEAYVVCTDGALGKSKGIPVIHKSGVNSIETGCFALYLVPGDRVLQIMAISSQCFQWDLWTSLSSGATLVLPSDDIFDKLRLINVITCTPYILRQLGSPCDFQSLKTIAIVGGTCSLSLCNIWTPIVRFLNLYFPSEYGIMTHYAALTPNEQVTIGMAIPNLSSYILDKQLQPVDRGIVGELYLGNVNVSSGHCTRSQDIEIPFQMDPFETIDGALMLSTGDLAFMRLDGCITLMENQENRVELKGCRVDMNLVSAAMKQHPDVQFASAIVEDSERVVGFYTPSTVNPQELWDMVAKELPMYMVPVEWVGLEIMPINNGKFDQKALIALPRPKTHGEMPMNTTESRVAAVWASVLSINPNQITPQSTFNSLGGDSLLALKIASECRRQGLYITTLQLQQASSLAEVALFCKLELIDDTNDSQSSEDNTSVDTSWMQGNDSAIPATTNAKEATWRAYISNATSCCIAEHIEKSLPEIMQENLPSLEAHVEITKLQSTAQRTSMTLLELVQLAWSATLRKYTRQDDILFGFNTANHEMSFQNAERTLDPPVTIIPCRVQFPADDDDLSAILESLRSIPGEDIYTTQWNDWVNAMEPRLFDTLLIYKNLPSIQATSAIGNELIRPVSNNQHTIAYTIELRVNAFASKLTIQMVYDPNILSAALSQWILDEFCYTIELIEAALDAELERVDLWCLDPKQSEYIRQATCTEELPLPFNLLHQGFEAIAREHPYLQAVEMQATGLTYGELDSFADIIAAEMLNGYTVGTRVAVIMERSLEFILGLVAVLKAGATIVPLDASFPPKRLEYILQDAKVSCVISTNKYKHQVDAIETDIAVVYIDLELLRSTKQCTTRKSIPLASPDSDAFIVYTSGSTGKPKGVPVSHKGAVNAVIHGARDCGIQQGTRVMQFMAIGFDVCQWEVWKTLSNMATLVLRSSELYDVLETIDFLVCTPTGLSILGPPTQFPRLQGVCVAGEVVPSALKDTWSSHVRFYNGYGPSECSIMTHIALLDVHSPVHIGLPVSNTSCYILDRAQRQVPLGVSGEIYLGGCCVSSGYLNLPQESASRFLLNPFAPGKFYQSGDYGRLTTNGWFEIVGRIDAQVKLKGYRIELEEIAEVIQSHPLVVKSATALVRDNSFLVGYFSPATVSHDELCRHVASSLPSYMIPAVWIGPDMMPLNSNGKIDKKQLSQMHVDLEIQSLETSTEKLLALIWSNVLNIPMEIIGRKTTFVSLGGDSLRAIQIASACKSHGMFLQPTQLVQAMTLERVALICQTKPSNMDWPSCAVSISHLSQDLDMKEPRDIYPVSPLQSGMLYATTQDPSAYLYQMKLHVAAEIEITRIQQAVDQLIRDHSVLRSTFELLGDQIYQVIYRQEDAHVSMPLVSNHSIEQYLEQDKTLGFTIGTRYFHRFGLVATPECEHTIILTIHHALYDGWSLALLVNDLAELLNCNLVAKRPPYSSILDYVHAIDKCTTETFWRNYLMDASNTLLSDIASKSYKEAPIPVDFKLSREISRDRLQACATRAHVMPAELAQVAYAATLRKFTRQQDIVFGHVLSNRDAPVNDIERIVGLLISTVPCRYVFDDQHTISKFFEDQVVPQRTKMHGHTYVSPLEIQKWTNSSKLFDCLFLFQNYSPPIESQTVRVLDDDYSIFSNEYTFTLWVEPQSQESLKIRAQFDPSVVSWRQAAQVLDEFDWTLHQLYDVIERNDRVEVLWTLSPSQLELVQHSSFGQKRELPYQLVHHGFEQYAQKTPDAYALEFESKSLTYREVNSAANKVARAMTDMLLQVGSRVAIIMERCLEFPLALVSVMKIGATAIPLDINYPSMRLLHILQDANVRVVLTTTNYLSKMTELLCNTTIQMITIDSALMTDDASGFIPTLVQIPTSIDEAVILFTSGSTGKPKGVILQHQGIINVITSTPDAFGLRQGARVAQFLAIGFDMCQWEIWGALCNGATLVIRGEDAFETLSTVDTLICTPTGLALLGDPSNYPLLKHISLAGEPLPTSLKDLWSPVVWLNNCCGPTETTIISHGIRQYPIDGVHVGLPLSNMNCYVYDTNLRTVPLGVCGEMYLSGIGITLGYLNLPEETAAKYTQDPFGHGRMYRSCDFGRILPNGHFEIIGRQDNQIKLKGYRIELDEVSNAIRQHPQVVAATAVVKDNSYLVGYFTPAFVSKKELTDIVSSLLPMYMIPAIFVGLDSMPQTTNGKIDRAFLTGLEVEIRVDELISKKEKLLAEIWALVLHVEVDTIGRQTSFIALGGDSIVAIRLVSKAKQMGLSLTTANVLKHPTLETMARVAKPIQVQTTPVLSIQSDTGHIPMLPLQVANFQYSWENPHFWNLSLSLNVKKIRLTVSELERAVNSLVRRHSALRIRYEYNAVDGWSQSIQKEIEPIQIHVAQVDSQYELQRAIMEIERSLHLIDGPIFRVSLFEFADKRQIVHITLHHTISDFITWQILKEDLQSVLEKRELEIQTTSLKEWTERLVTQASHWDPEAWRPFLTLDTPIPANFRESTVVKHAIRIPSELSSRLNEARSTYNTTIQDMALAALVSAWSELNRGGFLPLMMEGHGREAWATDLDVSNTVGWFTCEFPIVLSALDDTSHLVLHVKETIRSIPHGGLSYNAIKYLAPVTSDRQLVQSHQQHHLSFNYMSSLQGLHTQSLFEPCFEFELQQRDDVDLSTGSILLAHAGNSLDLHLAIPTWILSPVEIELWAQLWSVKLERIVEHCLDPKTVGGKILKDVPLIATTRILREIEADMMQTLGIRPRDIQDLYPVTGLQSGLLAALQLDPAEYVLQAVFDIRGNFSYEQLKTAGRKLANQAPVLRTVFSVVSDGMYQGITENDATEWSLLDETWLIEHLETRTSVFLKSDRLQGFHLSSNSFQRFTAVQVSDGSLRVFWTIHHAIVDGWSLRLLMDQLVSLCHESTETLAIEPFIHHVEWLQLQDLEASHSFWVETLTNINDIAPLRFPKPTSRPPFKYHCISRTLFLPEMKALCHELQVTPSSVFRTAWAILLQQYTRSEHVIFGTIVSGRDHGVDGVERMAGMLINSIPVLLHVSAESTVADLIRAVHEHSIDLMAHAHIGLTDIQKWLHRSEPIFDSMMMYENLPKLQQHDKNAAFHVELQDVYQYVESTLGIAISPQDEGYTATLSYRTWEIDSTIVDLLMSRFVVIVQNMVRDTSQLVRVLDCPTVAEQPILDVSSAGPTVSLPFHLLHHGFEVQVNKQPDIRALEYEDRSLSYSELNHVAEVLASMMDISAGSRVGVIMERCLELPVALVATLKAGGVMLPLDASFPAQRLDFMIQDANPSVILTVTGNDKLLHSLHVSIPVITVSIPELLNQPLPPTRLVHSSDEAFIVYTSGSTGTPKGVVVRHESAVNVVAHTASVCGITRGTRVFQLMAIGFDGFQCDLWRCMTHGATLVLRSKENLNAFHTIDSVTCTPTALSLLGDPLQYPNLKVVCVAGESCSSSLVDTWSSHVRLFNLYGPSECAIMTHYTELHPNQPVTVGKPFENIKSYILDDQFCPVPVGVVGEIYLGGLCVSNGYLNRIELSIEKFLVDPFHRGQMYRTGDHGRLNKNGDLEIIGRKDNQIKLKGYRIELDEIANTIQQHPMVELAAVVVIDSILIGFYSPENLNFMEIKKFIENLLPFYMIPTKWIGINKFILNTNGKIDKNILLKYNKKNNEIKMKLNKKEEKLAKIWSSVLKIDFKIIQKNNSFLELGGNSITIIQVLQLCKKNGYQIKLQDFLRGKTLSQIVEKISK